MTANGWFQIGFFLLVIFLITKPLGVFLARVFSGQKNVSRPHSAANRKTHLSPHGH